MDIIIITGLSGAGKSQAANALEDIGFFCIDNMPPSLIPRFAEMCLQLNKYNQVAIVTDVRTGELFSGFFDALEELKRINVSCKILFLDATDDCIEKRYRATRRKHPLASSDISLADAIRDERMMLKPVSELANYRIDTTYISVAELKDRIVSIFLKNSNFSMLVRSMSFGFKYGVPTEADLMLDVRCLPNPFYIDNLKEKTGLNQEVRDYVFSFDSTTELVGRFYSMIDYLLPLYKKEGKSQLIIGIGCTGGKHRSVSIAEDLCKHIQELDYSCGVIHRDINKLL